MISISKASGQELSWKTFEDSEGSIHIHNVLDAVDTLQAKAKQIYNFSFTKSKVWFYTEVQIDEPSSLFVENPTIGKLDFFLFKGGKMIKHIETGNYLAVDTREIHHPGFIFKVPASDKKLTLILKVSSQDPLIVPFTLKHQKELESYLFKHDVVGLLVTGVLLSLVVLYLVIFISLKERPYLLYLMYALTISLTILRLNGYSSFWLWPDFPVLNQYPAILEALPAMSAGIFGLFYLRLKEYYPLLYKIILGMIVLQGLVVLLSLLGFSQSIILCETIAVIYIPIITVVSALVYFSKGYRPAKYFLISSFFLFVGSVIYVLINYNIVETTNIFFRNSLQIGIALEMSFLAIGVSKKIDNLRKDYVKAQEDNVLLLQEKEEQLSQQVQQKTLDLKNQNVQLKATINQLKSAQFQLVKAEKFASVGVLTAGIAHEINNPINYIQGSANSLSSNMNDLISLHQVMNHAIKKLAQQHLSSDDISKILATISQHKKSIAYSELVTETESLLDNIQAGAHRTAEIVASLQSISQMDDNVYTKKDIVEDIKVTLSLVSQRTTNVIVETYFDDLPKVDYSPGKISQAFLILLNNALDAIEDKGRIIVSAKMHNSQLIEISFEDNGLGITEEIKSKIFDPFFTTKPVGSGTGIGLSIAKSIIESHEGNLTFESEMAQGSKFIIVLPIVQKQLD